jgi:hypothetical protein
VVERPDTPQIRGLVAKVSHLVSVVEESAVPAWESVAEYSVRPPDAVGASVPITPAAEVTEAEKAIPVESQAQEGGAELAPLVEEKQDVGTAGPVALTASPETTPEKAPVEQAVATDRPRAGKGAKKKSTRAGKAAISKTRKPAKARTK